MIPNIIHNKLPPVDYDRIAFIAEHYEELKQMYFTIMEHLKIPDGESNGEGSLWEDAESISFIPLYITFTDVPQEIINNITYTDMNHGKHLPLFKVENTTYALPIPFEEINTFVNINGDMDISIHSSTAIYSLSDGAIAMFPPDDLSIPFANKTSLGITIHNHATVSITYNRLSLLNLADKEEEFTFNRIKPKEDKQVLGG